MNLKLPAFILLFKSGGVIVADIIHSVASCFLVALYIYRACNIGHQDGKEKIPDDCTDVALMLQQMVLAKVLWTDTVG